MAQWNQKLELGDIFHKTDLALDAKTEIIAERIRNSRWFDSVNADGELAMLLEELFDAATEDDTNHWNLVWGCFYDLADVERIWVTTF